MASYATGPAREAHPGVGRPFDLVAGDRWSEWFGRSSLGPNVFVSRIGWLPALFSRRGYPQARRSAVRGLSYVSVAFADGGWFCGRQSSGSGLGGLRGEWVVGFGALRHVCALVGLVPPGLLKGERAIPDPALLAAEVARQMREDRGALEQRAELLPTTETPSARIPTTAFGMMGGPGRPRFGLDEADTAAMLDAASDAFLDLVTRSFEEGRWWSPSAITGYRGWSLRRRGSRYCLEGQHRQEWAEGTLHAECLQGPRDLSPHRPSLRTSRPVGTLGPPHTRHRCGIYAYKDLDTYLAAVGVGTVMGRVELWGKVIEHERGYRAQHCRIVRAAVLTPSTEELSREWPDLIARYGDLTLVPLPLNKGPHWTASYTSDGALTFRLDPAVEGEVKRILTA